MTAQPIEPVEDPRDPQVILCELPEREHEFFLQQYHEAVDAAHDLAGYQRLQRTLQSWSARARILKHVLAQNPNYYEDLEAEIEGVRNGTIQTVPIEDVIPDWNERVAAARSRR